jgi:hypothetical protein
MGSPMPPQEGFETFGGNSELTWECQKRKKSLFKPKLPKINGLCLLCEVNVTFELHLPNIP